MDVRLLMDAAPSEDAALDRFQALRQACRAGVRRHASVGAAVLFSGQVTSLLLEGRATELDSVQASLLTVAPGVLTSVPLEPVERGLAGRLLPQGTCRVGYISEEEGIDLTRRSSLPMAERVRHFLSVLANSDHD